jgi:GT2 family glycosyltransferase
MNRLSEQISIVIIARNRAQSLEQSLKHLTTLREHVPVIIVDNHSEDNTVQLVREKYPEVNLLQLPENYGSAGRNIGVERARTPYIAFADDDSWWREDALRAATVYFEKHPQLGLIQGKIILHGKRIEPVCQLMEESPLTHPPEFPGKAILGFVACGAMVRREAFLAVGGFHHQFGVGGEEELLALDMAEQGWLLAYCDDLIAFHNPSPIRNKIRRKQLAVRNHLWSVWLRRPLRSVCVETSPLLQKAVTDSNVRKGVLEAFAGLPWILKERKPLSEALEREIGKLSAFHP